MARLVNIAACNFAVRPVGSFDEFAAHVREHLDKTAGAELVLFPELFTVELFTAFDDWKDTPATELGRVDAFTDDYRGLFAAEAKERGQFIVAGSHLMKVGDGLLNVGHLFEPDGAMHLHEKTHIFPAEADWFTGEGDAIEVIELPFAKVAFNICYEAEIPECAATATEQGAEIILCPSFTFTEFGFWRVRHCAQARALSSPIGVGKLKKPWIAPLYLLSVVSTPACLSFSAYNSPCGQSGSCSAVTTSVGGKPAKLFA